MSLLQSVFNEPDKLFSAIDPTITVLGFILTVIGTWVAVKQHYQQKYTLEFEWGF